MEKGYCEKSSHVLKCLATILVFVIVCMTISGSDRMSQVEENVIYFSFSESGYPGYYEAEINKLENGNYSFDSDGFWDEEDTWGYNTFANKHGTITNEQFEKLQSIIEDLNIRRWNGFNKKDKYILDGSSFKLLIKYDTGKGISAYGYMRWPEGYDAAQKAIFDYLYEIASSVEAE